VDYAPTHRRLNNSERRVLGLLRKLGVRVIPSVQIERWEVDFLLPDQMAIVEVDGPGFHTRPEDVRRDRGQDARFRELGLLPIHCWTSSLHTEEGPDKLLKHVVERLYHERGVVLPSDRFRRYYKRLGSPR
jgi:very-short-patch-repair endonuclease